MKQVTKTLTIVGPDKKATIIVYDNTTKGYAIHATKTPMHVINITPAKNDCDLLDTFIHEGLHICDDDLKEPDVARYANFISGMLWQIGYRRVDIQARKRRRKSNA